MDLSNLVGHIPLSKFTKEQKRICILMRVASEFKFMKLKDNNVPKAPTAYSTRLWGVGRNAKGNTKMINRIDEDIKLQVLGAEDEEEIKEIMNEISNEIIEHSMVVMEDLLCAARNAKTPNVRRKYIKAVNNPEYLRMVFMLSIVYYAKYLISMGENINHMGLTLKIKTVEDKKRELNNIWKEFAESDKDSEAYSIAIQKTEEIFETYEKEVVINNTDIDKLADERMLYNLMGTKNVDILINRAIDKVRENLTGEIRLLEIY